MEIKSVVPFLKKLQVYASIAGNWCINGEKIFKKGHSDYVVQESRIHC